jgi:hypothetical protein
VPAVTRGQPQEVLGVGAEIRLVRLGVHPHAAEDEQPGLLLAREGEELLEALAVEQRDGEVHPVLGGQLASNFKM